MRVSCNRGLIKIVLIDCGISIGVTTQSNNMDKIDFFGQIIDTIEQEFFILIENIDERIF